MNKSQNPVKNRSSKIPTSVGDKSRLWFYGQVALVCLLIIGVWSLVSLPIIFFHLPESKIPSNSNGSTNASGDNSVCSAPVQYVTTSSICLKELADILTSSSCLAGTDGSIAVMRNEEVTARQLINGFASLGASAECLSKAVPFLCLHVFGLCGGSGVSIQPTSSQCKEVRDITCQQQWMFIERLDIDLPECEIFPSESLSCPALNDSLPTNGTVTTNMTDALGDNSSGNAIDVLECSGDFYQENGSSYCTRSCSSWVQFGRDYIITDVLTLLFTSVSILTAAAIIIISCLVCKRMLIFPAVFIIYILIDYLVLDLFIFVGFMDRDKLFCTSRSLSRSLREVTSFCTIFGVVFTYIICQIALWWLLHTTAIFWKVIFPLHALSIEKSGKIKYIHITCIIVGILLPLVPIVTTMAADTAVDYMEPNGNYTLPLTKVSGGLGFGPIGFPPILCSAINPEASFYSLILMVDLMLGCGCTMLIIIFWSVHQLYIKRKQLQKSDNLKEKKHQFTFGTAEKKLLIVFCYYVVLAAIVLTVFTWDTKNGSFFKDTIQTFLICELGSYDSNNSCTFSDPDSSVFDLLQILSFVLLNLLPVVNLLYLVNFQGLKERWRKWMVHGSQKSST